MRAWTIGSVLIGVAILAGCGSGSAKTVTVAQTQTTATGNSPTSSAADPKAALAAYLASFEKIRSRIETAADAVDATSAKFNQDKDDPSAWPQLAPPFQHYAALVNKAIPEFLALTPPAALRSAQRQYVAAGENIQVIVSNMARDLRTKDQSSMLNDVDTLTSTSVSLSAKTRAWKYAVIAYAGQVGLPVPAWVNHVGS